MFDWDDANLNHIRRHGVEPTECEQALSDARQVPLPGRTPGGEPRGSIIGRTAGGRLLVVIYTMRASRFRVVTAWPAGATARPIGRFTDEPKDLDRLTGRGPLLRQRLGGAGVVGDA